MALRKGSEHKLSWGTTPLALKPINHSWSEDGKMYGEVVFKQYYDTKEKSIFLVDILDDVRYKITTGQRTKGYTLAFKLMKRYLKN